MRVLLIDGTAGRGGEPMSEPRGAWVPEWNGSARDNPGETESYASDRRSGVQRTVRRPSGLYVAPRLAMSDVAELASPLRELADPGLLLESSKNQDISAGGNGNWDLVNDWTVSGSPTRTAGQRGPTGESTGDGQAYLIQADSDNERVNLVRAGLSNLNANTYVFSVWARKPAGVSGLVSLQIVSVGTVRTTTTITDQWTRISVATLDRNTTSATLSLFPGGSTTDGGGPGDAYFWAPQFVLSGAGAGNTERGTGSTIAPLSTRVSSSLEGPFVWPLTPWTFYARFTPFWGSDDGLEHRIFETSVGAGKALVMRLIKTAANDLELLVVDRTGTTITASVAPAIDHREEWRVVGKLGTDGSLRGWLNEAAFSTQQTGVLVQKGADNLILGGGATRLSDILLHRLEVWDEDVPANEFFGARGLERAA